MRIWLPFELPWLRCHFCLDRISRNRMTEHVEVEHAGDVR